MTSTEPPTRDPGTSRRLAILSAAAFVVAFGLAGCQAIGNLYLSPFTGGSSATSAPAASESMDCGGSVDGQVDYSAGQASMALTNGPTDSVVLSSFDNGSYVSGAWATTCGDDAQASWLSDDGTWALLVGAFPPSGTGTIGNVEVTIAYKSGDAAYGADGTCTTTNTVADASGFTGVAHCTNLTWDSDPGQTPAPSSAFTKSFGATITFEARP
jgi:hypothetical protein